MSRDLVLSLSLVSAACGSTAPAHAHGVYAGAERWAQRFDDPARDAWQRPDDVLRALDLAPTMTVADVGAGTGYFAVRLAREKYPAAAKAAPIGQTTRATSACSGCRPATTTSRRAIATAW